MNSLKKLSLIFTAIAFCLSLAVTATYAQPGRAKWQGNNGKHKGWYKGKHKGWDKRDDRFNRRNARLDRRIDRSYSRGRLSAEEYRRLERRRMTLHRVANRYQNTGRGINNREQRRLNRQYNTYNRRYRRAVRN